ncbi:MAG: hypothetical protein JSW64_06265 [Candidatus Zixiibacteriota bacterium]|nr:MAG: hypothetical protein JSW64_06265 [candidate division Zixibacteria bacterium]
MEILILSKYWYWFAVLSVAALAIGIYSYKKSYPPLSKFWRILLAVFRGIALLLLGFLLIEPLLNAYSERTVKSRLAVLIDDTSSMGIITAGISRIDLADSLVSAELSDVDYRYDVFTFSHGKTESDALPSAGDLSGDATSISGALKAVESSKNFHEYGAVLLVTDGGHNLGVDPVDQAANLDIPVFTLTVGEEIAEGNISISDIVFPPVAYSGDKFKIEAEISGRGLGNARSRLVLSEGGKMVGSAMFEVPSEGRNVKADFEIEAPDPGNIEYRISTPVLEKEIKTADNERIIVVRVLKSKINVFIGASSLNWEFKFIKQALNQFDEFNIDAVYPESPGRFSAPGPPRGLSGLNKYDAVIFVNCSPPDLRIAVDDLKSFLSGGRAMLYVAGRDYSSSIRRFGGLLPLEVQNVSVAEGDFFFEPATAYRQHAAISISENPDKSDRYWNSLPPLSRMITGIKPTGEILLEGRSGTGPSRIYPLLVAGRFEKGRVVAVTGFPLWKSHFGSANLDGMSDVIPKFWKNLLRWASSADVEERFKAFTDQKVYRLGEPIKFTAYLNDESNSPRNGALMTVSITREEERLKFKDAVLAQTGNGIYEGEMESPGTGRYVFEVVASSYDDTLGVFSGEFTVESFSLEMASSAPDYKLTQRIAEVTGGAAYNVDSIKDFSENIKLYPYIETELSQVKPFGMPAILAIILILLCVEWGLRKRFRLP